MENASNLDNLSNVFATPDFIWQIALMNYRVLIYHRVILIFLLKKNGNSLKSPDLAN